MAFVSNPQTLGELLEAILDYSQGKNRLIQHIVLDGENIHPNDLTPERHSIRLDDIETLTVETANAETIIQQEISNLKEILPELPSACHNMAQVMQSNTPQNAFQQFNDLMDVWDAVKEREEQICHIVKLDPAAIKIHKHSLSEHNVHLEEHIQKAKLHLESSHFAELGDLLSYELADFAEDELLIVNQISQLLAEDNS
jgi:hypothetical protein